MENNKEEIVISEVFPIMHQLEYSIWSTKVSWCPICNKHFYNERNEKHSTEAINEHYHLFFS